MSYSGLGLTKSAATSFNAGLNTAITGTGAKAPSAMVDVGVDPGVIIPMRTYLTRLMRDSPPQERRDMALGVSYLNTLRPNAFGRFDPAKVAQGLRAFSEGMRLYLDSKVDPRSGRYPVQIRDELLASLNRYTPSKLLADIAAGKFAGKPAPSGRRLLSPKQVPTRLPPPPNPIADVACTDGYFRDAAGLCVPNAVPPVPTPTTDIIPLPAEIKPTEIEMKPPAEAPPAFRPPPETYIDDEYGPPGPPPAPVPEVSAVIPAPGLFGVAYKWWAVGAVGVVGIGLALRSRKVTPNKRRHSKRRR